VYNSNSGQNIVIKDTEKEYDNMRYPKHMFYDNENIEASQQLFQKQ